MNGIGMSIVFFIIGLLILFAVIETAVRNGINSSIIGKYLESQSEIKEDKKSFLDDDLDNNKQYWKMVSLNEGSSSSMAL